MTLTVDNAMTYLSMVAATLTPDHQRLVNVLFQDSAFEKAPGSTKHHHDYLGGLALHTAEVVSNVFDIIGADFITTEESHSGVPFINYAGPLKLSVLLVSALLHDYCKTLEYQYELERVEAPGQEGLPDEVARMMVPRIKPGTITRTEYSQTVSHVVGSTMVFQMNAMRMGLPLDFIMDVMHTMLAHHGRLEWRSPVEPKTFEAWVLHAADMLSAQPLQK